MIFENFAMMMISYILQYHGWFALSQKSPQGQIVPLHWRYHNISPQGKISPACNRSTIAIRMYGLGVPILLYFRTHIWLGIGKNAQYILGEALYINFCLLYHGVI